MKDKENYFKKYRHDIYTILCKAYNNVPFYNKTWKINMPTYEKFTYGFFCNNVPILGKEILRNNSEKFLNSNVNKENLYMEMTSGTEGKPIVCYRSKKEQLQCAITQWNFRRKYIKNLSPNDKFAHFYVFRKDKEKLLSNCIIEKGNELLCKR